MANRVTSSNFPHLLSPYVFYSGENLTGYGTVDMTVLQDKIDLVRAAIKPISGGSNITLTEINNNLSDIYGASDGITSVNNYTRETWKATFSGTYTSGEYLYGTTKGGVLQGGLTYSGVPNAEVVSNATSGQFVPLWVDSFGRLQIAGFDASVGAVMVSPISSFPVSYTNISLTSLTGLLPTEATDVSSYERITMQMTASSLGANYLSGQGEFSMDNSTWHQAKIESTSYSGMDISANRWGITGNVTIGVTWLNQGQYFRNKITSTGIAGYTLTQKLFAV